MLDDLIARIESGAVSAEDAAQEAPLHRGDSVAVTIYLSGNVDGVVSFLENNGGSNISSGDDYIEAYVPVLKLAETSEQPGVLRVRVIQPPEAPQSQSGIPGDGSGVHGSPAWNQAGYSGQGIKVGVIDSGFSGFADLMGSEVSATVQARCYQWVGAHSQDLNHCADGGNHGTRVAESVMDIAPDVSLYIADPDTLSDLKATVEWMVSEGVSIINHSMTWLFDGPGDGTSPLSISPLNTVDRAVAAGIVWVNAAGNQAQKTWFKRGPFSYSTITVDGEEMRVLNFDGSNFTNRFHLSGPLQLRWTDTWGGATSDLDLLLVRPGEAEIELGSIDPQSGGAGQNPYESVRPAYELAEFDVLVAHISGREPDWIQLLGWSWSSLAHNTPETGSIGNPAESANPVLLAVGAAHWDSVGTIRPYSSRGPTPDGRIKPDLVGADCGETASSSRPFCGTSQASPHVAGLAALVRQRFPDYTPAQVASYLKDNAQQRISSPDPNNTWGHGFIVLPPNPPQYFGPPSIDTVTAGVNALTIGWSAPASDGGSTIAAYDLRHIQSDATDKSDSNWTVVQDVWTGSGALSYELTGLTAGTQYDVQMRAVNATGDGPWSATAMGTPTIAPTPCSSSDAVPNPHDNLDLVADCDILLAVRDILAGSETLNWATSTPITNWTGVVVEGTPRRVTVLYLGIRGLSGTIPAELGSLTGLTQLTIVDGQLSGPIPPELGSITNLTGLHLFSNQLTGEIPEELAQLTNLQDLSLYDNQLTGTIPSELANLTRLEALHIDTNRLSGSIPPELGSLTNLRWLTLHDNQLTGEIPAELGRLTNLEQVWLAGNRFTGCVPSELRSVASTDRSHRLKEIGIPYCDVLLNGLSTTGADLRPSFDPYVTGYTAAATASSITVSAASRHNATFQYLDQNDGVLADADGAQAGHQVDVPAGMVTTIRIRVITSDGLESRTYRIEVTGLGGLSSPSIRQITSGVSSLTVSWREPSQTGGSAITAYDLRHIRSDASSKVDSNWTVVQDVWTGSDALSYELDSLQGGVQYDIQVRAVNATGDGPWSATVTQTARGMAPGAPTSLAATAVGQTQIDLSWSAPQNTAGGTITGYRIEVSLDGSGWSDLVADSRSTTTSYSHTGLTASSTRHYRVSAINSEGTGPASNVANATTGAVLAPDLVVGTPTVSTSAPIAGASFTVNATVRNQGTGPSGFIWLHYYESTDSNITSGDKLLATSGITGLAPSASKDERQSLTAPSSPGPYYYGACVDAVSGESNTTNNCSSAIAVTVGAAPAPDLVVDTPTANPNSPTAGVSFTLNATVRNQGNGRSDSTTLRYYQSTDSNITTSDTAVGTDSVSGLNASRSGNESIGLTAPSNPGTYYYGACVDVVTGESDTINNCSSGIQVTVGAAPAPDLVVDTPTVSNRNPMARVGITLNATVQNRGNRRSDSTTLRYYQSTDSTITTGDTEVDTDHVSSLAASRSGNESVNLTAPTNPGTYYLGACVDAVTGESDTTNNCSTAVTVTVGAAPTPDLVVDAPTVSDSNPSVGASYTLDTRVRNQGSSRADSTTLRYYESTDSTITTGDRELDTDYVSRLDPSESGDESVRLTAISPGTYYLGACVDAVSNESDLTNNCSVAVAVTIGAAPTPDLVVDTPTVSNSAPAEGARITLNATVRNQGSGNANSTTLRYYRSTDSTITTGDTQVGRDSVSSLSASRSGGESISLIAPTTAGTYHYGACVDAVSDESDMTNNCSSAVTVTVGSAPAPDLVVGGLDLGGSVPMAGKVFLINAVVSNSGSASSPETTIRYYRSSDSTISSSDTEVDTVSVIPLGASGGYVTSIRPTAPSTAGTYYYGACVDAVSGESDTTNNCSSAVTVTVGAAPAPDLVVDTPTASPRSPMTGSSVTLNATARNQGNAAAGVTTLRYYRSTDTTITTDDTEVGTNPVSGLNASGSSAESVSLTAPSTAGTYYYGACVDAVTGESDTTNNCSAAVAVAVGTVSAPDLVVDMGGGTGTSVAGAKFDIQLAVRNQGSAATSASTTLRYYRSTDAVITNADTEVGTDSVGTVAGSNGISRHSIDLIAPSTKGTYYYGACVDAAAGETNTTNNCSSSRTIAITALGPDLVVTQVNVPVNSLGASTADPFEGEDFWISIHVKNQGDSRALSPTVRFYRSADTTISTSDTEIGTLGLLHMAASTHFDGGSIKTLTTAPTAAGTYHYGACVDFVEGESDKTNNCSSAEAVTVVSASGSDLIIESFRIQAIEVYFPTLPLYATVRNRGTGTSASTPVRFYLSADSNISKSDTRIDGQYVKRLAPSETGTAQVTTSAENAPGTYYYGACVLAVSGETDTTNNCSSAVEVTVGDDDTASVPGKPTGLTATADGQSEIDLSWTAPSSDGGASITGYKIEVSTDNSSWSDLVANTGSTATSYSHTGLTAGSTRYYRVSAINSAGTGTASNVANATTAAAARTNSAPIAVGAIPEQVITSGVEITLDVSTYFSVTDGDDLSYSVDSPTLFNDLSVSGSTVTMRVDGPLCDPTTVTVTARDPGGLEANQQFTVRRSNSPPEASSGTFPAQTIGVGKNSGPLYMGNWFSDPDTCDSRLKYVAASSDTSKATATASGNTVTITGVSPGTATVTVTAQDTGSLEATLDIQVTVIAGNPGAPTGLTATANGQTGIDLSWTAPSSDGGASITGYKIEVSTDNSSWSDLVANIGSTGTSYSHTGLTAGSTRYYRVSAINSVGTGPASTSDSATTEQEAVSDGTCTVNLIVEPGESCTYPGTSAEFSVDSSGSGSFLIFSSGSKIEIRNSTINSVIYTFVASKQSSGNWLVEEVG